MLQNVTIAQPQPEEQELTIRSVGFSLVYADAILDENIRDHIAMAGFYEFPLSRNAQIRTQIVFFQSERVFPWSQFHYRGSIYIAQRPRIWKNLSLDGIVLWRITRSSSIGAGIGVEFIRVRRVYYTSDQVFWVNFFTDTPHIMDDTIIEWKDFLVRPSVSFVSETEWELGQLFLFTMGFNSKMAFVGEKYGHSPFNSQITFGISAGLKYRF
jgi:hypothetical protein